jgi:uncharacterized DUF497 family protein
LRFIWDYDNITHIALHNVTPQEVEDAMNGDTLDLEFQDWNDEERFSEVGATTTGRFLVVWMTWRDDGIRVVTAYDAPRKVIKEYLEDR